MSCSSAADCTHAGAASCADKLMLGEPATDPETPAAQQTLRLVDASNVMRQPTYMLHQQLLLPAMTQQQQKQWQEATQRRDSKQGPAGQFADAQCTGESSDDFCRIAAERALPETHNSILQDSVNGEIQQQQHQQQRVQSGQQLTAISCRGNLLSGAWPVSCSQESFKLPPVTPISQRAQHAIELKCKQTSKRLAAGKDMGAAASAWLVKSTLERKQQKVRSKACSSCNQTVQQKPKRKQQELHLSCTVRCGSTGLHTRAVQQHNCSNQRHSSRGSVGGVNSHANATRQRDGRAATVKPDSLHAPFTVTALNHAAAVELGIGAAIEQDIAALTEVACASAVHVAVEELGTIKAEAIGLLQVEKAPLCNNTTAVEQQRLCTKSVSGGAAAGSSSTAYEGVHSAAADAVIPSGEEGSIPSRSARAVQMVATLNIVSGSAAADDGVNAVRAGTDTGGSMAAAVAGPQKQDSSPPDKSTSLIQQCCRSSLRGLNGTCTNTACGIISLKSMIGPPEQQQVGKLQQLMQLLEELQQPSPVQSIDLQSVMCEQEHEYENEQEFELHSTGGIPQQHLGSREDSGPAAAAGVILLGANSKQTETQGYPQSSAAGQASTVKREGSSKARHWQDRQLQVPGNGPPARRFNQKLHSLLTVVKQRPLSERLLYGTSTI